MGRSRRHLHVRARGIAEDQGNFHRVRLQIRAASSPTSKRSRTSPRRAGVPLIVDNTLATPYLCKPIDYGADIVVHSLTKFLGGHGNSIGGLIVDAGTFNWSHEKRYPMVCEPRPEYNGIVLHETFGNFAFAIACRVLSLRDIGPALSPMNAFFFLNGIETLPLRMQRHCDNALAVAEFLSKHPKIAWVSYPGLPGDRYHSLAQKYVPKGAGAVFTFGLKGGYDAGVKLVSNVQIVLASRQYRRYALADHSSGLDHPQATHRGAELRRRARARTWSACPSALRMLRILSAIWNRRWRRINRERISYRPEGGRMPAVCATASARTTQRDGLMQQSEFERRLRQQRDDADEGLQRSPPRRVVTADWIAALSRSVVVSVERMQQCHDPDRVSHHAVVELNRQRVFKKVAPHAARRKKAAPSPAPMRRRSVARYCRQVRPAIRRPARRDRSARTRARAAIRREPNAQRYRHAVFARPAFTRQPQCACAVQISAAKMKHASRRCVANRYCDTSVRSESPDATIHQPTAPLQGTERENQRKFSRQHAPDPAAPQEPDKRQRECRADDARQAHGASTPTNRSF